MRAMMHTSTMDKTHFHLVVVGVGEPMTPYLW